MAREITTCRLCGSSNLKKIISFGNQFLTNFPEKIDYSLARCPLIVMFCPDCTLLQLKHTADFDYLYKNYWYVSGVNRTMQEDLANIAARAEELIPLKERDVVVDIGSNDSTLLRAFKERGLVRVGFEPAQNLMDKARAFIDDIPLLIINNFFNSKDYLDRIPSQKAKIITAAAMFYDIDNPDDFVREIKAILDEEGVIIIQLNYLPIMLEKATFDNVSHEHLEYYSLTSLKYLFDKHNLDIFDIEFNDVNGGSIRIYLCNKNKRIISGIVKKILINEKLLKEIKVYREFAKKSKQIIKEIKALIKSLREYGKTIYVYGASTRGNALLQACGLTSKYIKAAVDRNPMKWGKYMVGSWIPIISEEQARKENPDYMLVLPWQFRKEFIEREQEFLDNGGKFIFVFPELEIYGK